MGVLGALTAFGACGSTSSPQNDDPARVLLFTRTEAFRHASIGPAVTALSAQAAGEGFEIEATEDPAAFTTANLGRFSAVVFLLTTGDVLDATSQSALMDYVRGGGGFVGIHSATDTEYAWPWYGALVGAYFDGHPSNPNVRDGRLLVADAAHPATRGLPTEWLRSDEWYDLRDLQEGLSVLLLVDETSYKTVAEAPAPDPRPIAWFRPFEGGRTFYTALGHTAQSWSEPLFLEHVWGGVTWVVGADG